MLHLSTFLPFEIIRIWNMCILFFFLFFFLSLFSFFLLSVLLFLVLLSYPCIVSKDRNIRTEVIKTEASSNIDNSVISDIKNVEKYVNRDN